MVCRLFDDLCHTCPVNAIDNLPMRAWKKMVDVLKNFVRILYDYVDLLLSFETRVSNTMRLHNRSINDGFGWCGTEHPRCIKNIERSLKNRRRNSFAQRLWEHVKHATGVIPKPYVLCPHVDS